MIFIAAPIGVGAHNYEKMHNQYLHVWEDQRKDTYKSYKMQII